jgi:ribosome-associated protein
MPSRTGQHREPISVQLVEFAVSVLEDMKAQDIRVLDVRHLTSLMDFMVVATGRSDRHVRAISGALVERCKERGLKPLGVEGEEAGEWVLVDLTDVVVHVMLARVREFYNIETLWEMPSSEERLEDNHSS